MAKTRGILYLIPNLLDPDGPPEAVLPAAAIARIRSLRRFVVEGEKAAWKLLSKVMDRAHAATVTMERLDEHSSAEELPALLAPLEAGEDVGLISEAGMPCIADPGAALAALAHDRGITVASLSGPSSLFLALAASGLDGQRFSFLGYLPQDPAARRARLAAIEKDVRTDGATRIFIETPYRNARLLEACLAVLSPGLRLCVAASLSSPSERVRSAPISAWRKEAWPLGKEPAVFLVGLAARPGSPARSAPIPRPPTRARDRRES